MEYISKLFVYRTHYFFSDVKGACSPIARETWVQSQVVSYQRLKKWYLMPPYLTLSIIRYGSRVKWSNPGKGVAPSPTPWCSKLSKREPSGHPRLWSPTLLTIMHENYVINLFQSKSNLATVVVSDQKVSFSVATTPRCRGGPYSFPWIAPLYP